MNPKANSSLRGRGKWGDFIVASIPLSWCGNILINSNFILRMIEWQNESSLFTLRVHGKQWYWVYKFDLKGVSNLIAAPKNIGHNRWLVGSGRNTRVFDTYLQVIQAYAEHEYSDVWFSKVKERDMFDFASNGLNSKDLDTHDSSYLGSIMYGEKLARLVKYTGSDIALTNLNGSLRSNFELKKKFNKNVKFRDYSKLLADCNSSLKSLYLDKVSTKLNYQYQDLENEWDIDYNVKGVSVNNPSRLLRNPIINKNYNLFKVRFFDANNVIIDRYVDKDFLYGFSQKKYKRRQGFENSIHYFAKDLDTKKVKELRGAGLTVKPVQLGNVDYCASRNLNNKYVFSNISNKKYSTSNVFVNNPEVAANVEKNIMREYGSELQEFNQSKTVMYKVTRNNKKRSQKMPVYLSRRLLRTKRTLVLPAHVNITVVTNSYDVVHSWFIPGLGLKLDCVPGRSTHHSFYLDNIGFYYGQCAEICGRFHHHMPIRVCALPFEHFLVWWHCKGLPFFLKNKKLKKLRLREATNLKYVW